MGPIFSEIENALNTNGERTISKALCNHPIVILWTFCWTGGHTKYIINGFEFGNQYRSDFVVLLSYSGNWEVYFIELENTEDKVITKAGKPSSRLNSAISQINDWKHFVDNNKRIVQEDLARACKTKDLLGFHDSSFEPSNFSGNLLKDPDTFINFNYQIIIGRRRNITKYARTKMNQLSLTGLGQINSYDRFLDVASNLDEFNSNPRQSIQVSEKFGI